MFLEFGKIDKNNCMGTLEGEYSSMATSMTVVNYVNILKPCSWPRPRTVRLYTISNKVKKP